MIQTSKSFGPRIIGPVIVFLAMWTGAGIAVSAQGPTYEDQAVAILNLFEEGKKDTAYYLIEQLKSMEGARFVPAVLYTRAQMTPDDRALKLYWEAIAIDSKGPWADDSRYQLVRRYVEKRDSLGAYAWFDVLKRHHEASPLVSRARNILDGIGNWDLIDWAPIADGGEDEGAEETETADAASAPAARPAATTTTATVPVKASAGTKTQPKPEQETEKTSATVPAAAETTAEAEQAPAAQSATTTYSVQAGLYAKKSLAETRAEELKKSNLEARVLPKMIGGKKQYAVVIGSYPTVEAAANAKGAVAKACDCGAFVVRVE